VLVVGTVLLARFGLFGDSAVLAGSTPPARHMAADNPWSKDYVEQEPGFGAYYANCAAARAAGVAPIHEGQPGYRFELDGDDDGIACEPYHGH
jgi:hypothetical protein